MLTSLSFVQQPRNSINKDEIFGTVVNCITLWLLRYFSITFKFFGFNHPSCKFFTALLKVLAFNVLAYNLYCTRVCSATAYLKTAYLIIFRSIYATKRKSSSTKHQVPFSEDSKSELVGLFSTLSVYTEPI